MSYLNLFDSDSPLDLVLVGRIALDFNPLEINRPLSESVTFKKYVGGSPANIAVGLARLGKKPGFIARVAQDSFGDYAKNYFDNEGIDTTHVFRAEHGEKMGLTFTEIKSPTESSILMYREGVADLALSPRDVDEEYIRKASATIFETIKELDVFKNAKTVMIYVSYQNEIYTHDFIRWCIENGKTVVTPVCREDRSMLLARTESFPEGFEETAMHILEIPLDKAVAVDEQQVDIIITPGLAFTPEGMRIGYGGGYYDRLFEKVRDDCLKIVPTFDDFIISDIPTGRYDHPVDILVSEKKVIFC